MLFTTLNCSVSKHKNGQDVLQLLRFTYVKYGLELSKEKTSAVSTKF